MLMETGILFHITLLSLLNLRSTSGSCSTRWPSCSSDENIVCTTDYGKPVVNCDIIYNDPEVRKAIVDSHNYYRNKVAIGNETRGAFRCISDMLAMSYDPDLEFTAQCQASRCIYDHNAPCYITTNFSEVGQNLNGRVFLGEDRDSFHTAAETTKMIAEWYEYEIAESNEKVFEDFSRMKTMLIGYLYQMLWAETYRIGCGRSCLEEKYHMMICNYGPKGLRVAKPLGRIGRPCTKCPEEMSCNKEYEGLCGEIDVSQYYITVSGAIRTFYTGACIWVVIFCFVASAVFR
ncbi:unnamed protein product [Callosobruchus maculatus]|uniref:SCP domain-containing protein n=1 Tax=Callosobruchus maculatus TaxID=64391 RepID=A0A653DEK3_CALMS|nr:unnamed protein product [Callosobruchus maculatus]